MLQFYLTDRDESEYVNKQTRKTRKTCNYGKVQENMEPKFPST